MDGILTKALSVVIIAFMVSAMLDCGLSLTLRQIFEPLRNIRLVISSAVASYVLVPLIGIMVSKVFGLAEPLKIGLVLFSMAAGSEAGPKVVGLAKGNAGLSVGLLVGQLGATIIYIPLLLSLFLPEMQFDHGKLLLKLCATVVLPTCAGLFVKARYGKMADRLSPYMRRTSSVSMVILAVLILVLNYKGILRLFGSGAIVAALIFVAASFLVGYLLGGPEKADRRTLAIMTGTRNTAISLMIASQMFDDPNELIMIVVMVIMMVITLLPLSLYLGRSSARQQIEI